MIVAGPKGKTQLCARFMTFKNDQRASRDYRIWRKELQASYDRALYAIRLVILRSGQARLSQNSKRRARSRRSSVISDGTLNSIFFVPQRTHA